MLQKIIQIYKVIKAFFKVFKQYTYLPKRPVVIYYF